MHPGLGAYMHESGVQPVAARRAACHMQCSPTKLDVFPSICLHRAGCNKRVRCIQAPNISARPPADALPHTFVPHTTATPDRFLPTAWTRAAAHLCAIAKRTACQLPPNRLDMSCRAPLCSRPRLPRASPPDGMSTRGCGSCLRCPGPAR
eukprot:361684-Chlamydomonas_euryale.AAC.2